MPSFSASKPTEWWERRLLDREEEVEWNYSTVPGSQTLELLWEHLSEASFWDSGSWPHWELGGRLLLGWQGYHLTRGQLSHLYSSA